MEKEIINEEFWLSSWDTVVVKVGSNVLAWDDNWINLENMKNISKWISYLMKIWLNLILVSSWAVAVWRNIMEKEWKKYGKDISSYEKSYLSTVGQSVLINKYIKLFEKKKIIITMWLLTHKNVLGEFVENNIRQNFENKTLAILNENDFVSWEELEWFSDNDELAWLIAKEINAKVLILLSDIDWIYKNFKQEDEKLIEEVFSKDIDNIRKEIVENTEESVWSWWWNSKLDVMQEMQKNWIVWILVNWKKGNIIKKVFKWKECKKTIFRV
jgi:glutamate 5-kinase